MKQETKEQKNKEEGFNIFDNYEIINNIPPPFKKVKEDKIKIIEFFDKIPENKVMRIKFPTESLWTTYHSAFKYYASDYPFVMQFNKRKDEGGYYVYIKKFNKIEVNDGKDMEIKSV